VLGSWVSPVVRRGKSLHKGILCLWGDARDLAHIVSCRSDVLTLSPSSAKISAP